MTTIDEQQEIDTGTTDLTATRRDGVLTLTLNRPERRNAMTPAMIEALAAQLHAAETSELVGAVVITGAGAAFCAGGDVKSFNERGSEGGPQATAADPARIARQQSMQRATVGRIYRLAKPVIAALPGGTAGAGLSPRMSCLVLLSNSPRGWRTARRLRCGRPAPGRRRERSDIDGGR